MGSNTDTPRGAFLLLPWRTNLVVVVALIVVSVLAWVITIDVAISMQGMVMGLGQIGSRVQGRMGATLILAMWLSMMTAMMLPTVAPMVLAHLAVARRRGEGAVSTIVFICGYLLAWSAIGVVPLVAFWGSSGLNDSAAQSIWLHVLAGTILVVAGVYQFTGWKQVCLDHCQSPVAFILTHDFRGGAGSALRAGIVHGLFCLGCCWALMTVLLVVGLMNLVWMAVLFALFFVEKHWRRGLALAKAAGGLLVVLGGAVMMWPALLEQISR